MARTNANGTKTVFCAMIPTQLYDRLDHDSEEYGVNKVDTLTVALMEYYKRRDKETALQSDV